MQPKIITEKSIILAGMSFYGDPFDTSNAWTEENQIGRLWQRLMRYFERNRDALSWDLHQTANYEVHIYGPETETEGLFEVFVGFKITDISLVPYDMVVKVLPPTGYAIFTLTGKAIFEDWEKEIRAWLDENSYQDAYPYNFQYYDQRFKGLDRIEESQIDVYIPIEKAA